MEKYLTKPLVTNNDPLDRRPIFYTNIQLLGFDPVLMEKKYRIPFHKDMFIHPNKKGFEEVVYFLFNKLNASSARERFRHCWPIGDKKQESEFRKVCFNWLSSISKEDPDCNFPRIVASLFMSPGGDKFYQFLFSFSTYVIMKVLQEEHGVKSHQMIKRPVITKQNVGMGTVMAKTLNCGIIRERQKFLDQVQKTASTHKEWKSYASELIKTNRNLTKSIRELERQIKAEEQNILQFLDSKGSPVPRRRKSGSSEFDHEVQNVKRSQKVQKVRECWKAMDEFRASTSSDNEIVESILQGVMDKYRIDASQLDVKVPGLLLTECEREIQRRRVSNVYQGGKLNILSLIHLWNLSLHLYIEKIHQSGVPNFVNAEEFLTAQAHNHHAHLGTAQTLRKQLSEETLPELKRTISHLKKKLSAEIIGSHSPESIRTTSIGLDFLPPTPPVNFDPKTPTATDNLQAPIRETLASSPDKVDTPEAALRLVESTSQRSERSHGSSLVQGSPVYASRMEIRGEPSVFNSLPTPQGKETQPKATKPETQKQRVRAKSAQQKYEVFDIPLDPKQTKPKKRLTQTVQSNRIKSHLTQDDQIVNDMMDSSPTHQGQGDVHANYGDLETALTQKAFETKNILQRTPPDQPTTKHSWHETLLHDSIGPLSSTRIENGSKPLKTKDNVDKLATRLFPEDDDNFTEDAIRSHRGKDSSKSSKQNIKPTASSKLGGNDLAADTNTSPKSDPGTLKPHDSYKAGLSQDSTSKIKDSPSKKVASPKQPVHQLPVSPRIRPDEERIDIRLNFDDTNVENSPLNSARSQTSGASVHSRTSKKSSHDSQRSHRGANSIDSSLQESPKSESTGGKRTEKLIDLDNGSSNQDGKEKAVHDFSDAKVDALVDSLFGLHLGGQTSKRQEDDQSDSLKSDLIDLHWGTVGTRDTENGDTLTELNLFPTGQALRDIKEGETPRLPRNLRKHENVDKRNALQQEDIEDDLLTSETLPFEPFKDEDHAMSLSPDEKSQSWLQTRKLDGAALAQLAKGGSLQKEGSSSDSQQEESDSKEESGSVEGEQELEEDSGEEEQEMEEEVEEEEETEEEAVKEKEDGEEGDDASTITGPGFSEKQSEEDTDAEQPLDGTARLIEFHDGTFHEYMEESPGKLKHLRSKTVKKANVLEELSSPGKHKSPLKSLLTIDSEMSPDSLDLRSARSQEEPGFEDRSRSSASGDSSAATSPSTQSGEYSLGSSLTKVTPRQSSKGSGEWVELKGNLGGLAMRSVPNDSITAKSPQEVKSLPILHGGLSENPNSSGNEKGNISHSGGDVNSSLSSDRDSLLERYKRLRQNTLEADKQSQMQSSTLSSEVRTSGDGGARIISSQPTAVINEKYLEKSPRKDTSNQTKRFSLGLNEVDEDFPQNVDPLAEGAEAFLSAIEQSMSGRPSSVGQLSPSQFEAMRDNRLSGRWDDILKEDDGFLVPSSPIDSPQTTRPKSPQVGNLIDF